MDAFLSQMVALTERVLTWRARRRWIRKQKQQAKNVLLDWIESFIWAAFVVLLVNQYAFQAYEIPSSSMERTLLVHDRIFVNKFLYGPELLPGVAKLPGLATPQRGDIIIFENPSYLSQGPVFDIAQRLLYMMTLSMVDIDREADGSPKAHFLIKRGVGYSGDTVRFRNGNPEFLLPGIERWWTETEVKAAYHLTYDQHREAPDQRPEYYALLPGASRAQVAKDHQLIPDPKDVSDLNKLKSLLEKRKLIPDRFETERHSLMAYLDVFPNQSDKASDFQRLENGRYIPVGSLLPLGDNRDNSRDGRYFGPVALAKILGGASFRYWPLGRLGGL